MREARGYIHDPATVVDQRQQLLRQEKHAFEVDVIEAVEFFFRRLLERVVMRGSRVVDEVVETLGAKIGERRLDRSSQRRRTSLHFPHRAATQ